MREVVEAARDVTGQDVPLKPGVRRAGDPAVLVASSEKIKKELGWSPQFQDLRQIVGSAWSWMQSHPNGYEN